MSQRLQLVAVVSLALALAGCAPQAPTPSSSSPAVVESETPNPSPTQAAPETVDPASFLLEGTPNVPDADGMWSGHYGFFTDATKTVRCDIYIFSGDSGGVRCGLTPGNEGKGTYALPAGVTTTCDNSASVATDGTSVSINFKVFPDAVNAGFLGCAGQPDYSPAIVAATKVLADNQTLVVTQTDVYSYTCTVAAGVASCAEANTGASITFGTAVAAFQG